MTEGFKSEGRVIHHAFQSFMPFIWDLVLKFRVMLDINVVDTVLGATEEWSKVLFESLFVALKESFIELFKERFRFLLKLDNLVFDNFLSLKFLLDF